MTGRHFPLPDKLVKPTFKVSMHSEPIPSGTLWHMDVFLGLYIFRDNFYDFWGESFPKIACRLTPMFYTEEGDTQAHNADDSIA